MKISWTNLQWTEKKLLKFVYINLLLTALDIVIYTTWIHSQKNRRFNIKAQNFIRFASEIKKWYRNQWIMMSPLLQLIFNRKKFINYCKFWSLNSDKFSTARYTFKPLSKITVIWSNWNIWKIILKIQTDLLGRHLKVRNGAVAFYNKSTCYLKR